MRLPRLRGLAATAAAPEKKSFLDLPSELRQEIYQYIFNDCIVRYHLTRRLSKRGKYVKVAYCHGPEQHRFLATCQKIYREALPVLKASVSVLFDGGVDAEAAFYNVASNSMSPFLRDIVLSTKKIVLSNPAEHFCRIRPSNLVGGNLPTFNSLEVVEIFGFYPKLSKWLYRDRPVHMGYPYWCWKIFGWESNGYATGCRKIHLTSAGDWLHAVTGRDVDEMTVFLNAWTYEKSPQRSDQADFYNVFIDADSKSMIRRDRLQKRPEVDDLRYYVEHHAKKYHRFVKFTEARRTRWLSEGDKLEST